LRNICARLCEACFDDLPIGEARMQEREAALK